MTVYDDCDQIVDAAEQAFKKLPLTGEELVFLKVKLYEMKFGVIPNLRAKDRERNIREMSVLGLKKEGDNEGKDI